MTLLRYEEFQGSSKYWYCNATARQVRWWHLPRLLDMTPADFVEFLVKYFKPDSVKWNGKTLIFCWKSQTQMRKFKNYINKVAREKKFYV